MNFEDRITINGSIETVKSLVKEGLGFTILPYHCVHEDVEKGELQIIADFDELKDGYQAVLTYDKLNNLEINKFLNFLQKFNIEE